ncbi:MAG: hypothetical protein HYX51_11560 [Chloroflexi bacterium]|nr:hypothetical protein [Chloroflexota bacterium]
MTYTVRSGQRDIAPYAGLIYLTVIAAITFVVGTLLPRETRQNSVTDERLVAQRGYSPLVLYPLVVLSAAALFVADWKLTPTLNTSTFNVQWFFRAPAAVVLTVSPAYVFSRGRMQVHVPPETLDAPEPWPAL